MAGSRDTGTSLLQELLDKMRSENKVFLECRVLHVVTYTLTIQKQMIHCLVVVSRLSAGIADKRDVGCEFHLHDVELEVPGVLTCSAL